MCAIRYVAIAVSANAEDECIMLIKKDIASEQRHRQFDRFYGLAETVELRFVDQKVDVPRHDDVTNDHELVLLPDSFQGGFEEIIAFRCDQIGLAVEATEGDEMHLAGLLVTNESLGHGNQNKLSLWGGGGSWTPRSENPDLGHPDFVARPPPPVWTDVGLRPLIAIELR
jgi:hypothetical protein